MEQMLTSPLTSKITAFLSPPEIHSFLMKSANILLLWKQLRQTNTMHSTPTHLDKQERLLPFLALDPLLRAKIFSEIARQSWGPGTRDSYWAAIHSAGKTLELPIPQISKRMQKHFHAQSMLRDRWNPADQTQFMTDAHLQKILNLKATDLQTLSPIVVAYQLGQRVADLLKLRTANVYITKFPRASNLIVLRFVEGKTVETVGPFSIFCPVSIAAGILLQWRLRQTDSLYVFFKAHSYLPKDQMSAQILRMEKRIHNVLKEHGLDLDLRATRRGGLSALAMQANSLDQVLSFSRHQTVKQLYAYLGHGAFDGATARTQTQLLEQLHLPQTS